MTTTITHNETEFEAIELPNKADITADIRESDINIDDIEQFIDDVEEGWKDGCFAAVGDQLQDGVAVFDDRYALGHAELELRPFIDAAADDLSKIKVGDLNRIFVNAIEAKFEQNTSHALKEVEN